jgi:hypothetical protein
MMEDTIENFDHKTFEFIQELRRNTKILEKYALLKFVSWLDIILQILVNKDFDKCEYKLKEFISKTINKDVQDYANALFLS